MVTTLTILPITGIFSKACAYTALQFGRITRHTNTKQATIAIAFGNVLYIVRYLIESIRVTDDLKLIINVKGGASVMEELYQRED